ncbi:MAG: hypothetical protein IKO52_14665 [Clostridia bacterium]|nr:hypothetical protein [Clostridia bacterium]
MKISRDNKAVFGCLLLLNVMGLVLGVVKLVQMFQEPLTLLGVLSNAIYLLSYLALSVYALWTYGKEGDKYFLGVVYAYAALLGIQLLQSGQAIASYGLSESLTLMINVFNLIAFANVLMFANKMNEKKTAAWYLFTAALLKLIGELVLIIKLWAFITPYIVLVSLSVPVLGFTILFTYLSRLQRLGK